MPPSVHPVVESLLKEAPVLLDGAWGTRLQALGLPVGACPDAWNLERPEEVLGVARSYVEAGSRIILSNTFGANRLTLARHGLQEKAGEINRAGAALSREAAGERALVFASMGPSGKLLLMGEVTEEELFEVFSEQAQALREGGAQGLAVETMGDIEEAVIAVAAAKATGLPVVGSMAYDSGADGDRTLMGVDPETQARRMEAAGVDVLGANCGKGADRFLGTCKALKAAGTVPIWVKANAGMPRVTGGRTEWPMTPEEFADYAAVLAGEGVAFLGGCCGTGPETIRALARILGPARR